MCGTIDCKFYYKILLRVIDLAPEIINKELYDNSVDVWCLGILLYEMLYGYAPFHSKTKEETFEKVKN